MGLSIDDCLEYIHDEYKYAKDDTDIADAEDIRTLSMIYIILQKYQKIEQIVKSKTTRLSYDIGFRQIKKVVEDG